jgi:predicted GNAT family N-acyltransferase
METGIFPAFTDEQKQAVYRLRYDLYVEEMGRYHSIADHENRLMIEPYDEYSRLYIAQEDDEVVGTMRLTWGADAPFPERMIEQYDLTPFLDHIPPEHLVVSERFMVTRPHRGTGLLFQMFCTYMTFVNENRIQLVFGDSEPHLLNLYQGMGFRTYTDRNVNSAQTGYLIPLVMVPEDLDYMQSINSPLLRVLKDFGDDARVPDAALRILDEGSAVLSQRLSQDGEYWSVINDALDPLDENHITLFDDMTDAEAQACLDKSSIIECKKGDRVLKKGNPSTNLFVVLSGKLDVHDGDTTVASLRPGDVFGEIAFLLREPRSMDVYAATGDVRIVSLSESAISQIIETTPGAAAKMLLNISKMLCQRLVNSS